MSRGRPEDLQSTIEQIRNPNPTKGSKTWLRHNLNTQAGQCDLMLLEGATIEKMAKELIRMNLDKENKGMGFMEERVSRHITALRAPIEEYDRSMGHNLSSVLKVDSHGVWKFVIDDFDALTLINGKEKLQSSSYLPNKEDFTKAYRALAAQYGEEVSIDEVLDEIEREASKIEKKLKHNWRVITEYNINIWQKG